jgi:hypothetical protein
MVDSQVTNQLRLTFALNYLVFLNLILIREPLPFSAEASRWLWLSLSGIIGFSLGDAFLFQALLSLGPRLGTLLLSLAPIFGSMIAWNSSVKSFRRCRSPALSSPRQGSPSIASSVRPYSLAGKTPGTRLACPWCVRRTVLGVLASLLAVQHAEIGVASRLMA